MIFRGHNCQVYNIKTTFNSNEIHDTFEYTHLYVFIYLCVYEHLNVVTNVRQKTNAYDDDNESDNVDYDVVALFW